MFSDVAHRTPGFVGADLMALTREASLLAINRYVRGGGGRGRWKREGGREGGRRKGGAGRRREMERGEKGVEFPFYFEAWLLN